jgi:hypothetical protein
MQLAGRERELERLAIRVRDHQHGAGRGILRHDRHQSAAFAEIQPVEVGHRILLSDRPAPARCA